MSEKNQAQIGVQRAEALQAVVARQKTLLAQCGQMAWALGVLDVSAAAALHEQLAKATPLIARAKLMLDRAVALHRVQEAQRVLEGHRSEVRAAEEKLADW